VLDGLLATEESVRTGRTVEVPGRPETAALLPAGWATGARAADAPATPDATVSA
jgi:hypothetical protein